MKILSKFTKLDLIIITLLTILIIIVFLVVNMDRYLFLFGLGPGAVEYYDKIHFRNILHTIKTDPPSDNNPHGKKEKVIVFQSHNYDELPEYSHYSKEIINTYCQRKGYEYKMLKEAKDEMSPYWIRVKNIKNFLRETNDGDIIVYFDLDSCVNPNFFDIDIKTLISTMNKITGKNHTMFVGTDPEDIHPIWKDVLNSGVMVVVNCDWTRKFVIRWLRKYPKKNWKFDKDTGKWSCSTRLLSCAWAGSEYEQGALNDMYNEDVMGCREKICRVHWTVLSNYNPAVKSCFVYHLMGFPNDYRLEYFKYLYSLLTYNTKKKQVDEENEKKMI